jgi:hypothetical protein
MVLRTGVLAITIGAGLLAIAGAVTGLVGIASG